MDTFRVSHEDAIQRMTWRLGEKDVQIMLLELQISYLEAERDRTARDQASVKASDEDRRVEHHDSSVSHSDDSVRGCVGTDECVGPATAADARSVSD